MVFPFRPENPRDHLVSVSAAIRGHPFSAIRAPRAHQLRSWPTMGVDTWTIRAGAGIATGRKFRVKKPTGSVISRRQRHSPSSAKRPRSWAMLFRMACPGPTGLPPTLV